MKKLSSVMFVLSVILFLASSCKKEDKAITQVENVKLFKNQNYTFVVPPNQSDDEFQITSQAKNYSISELLTEGGSENLMYHYKPALNFVGNDQVIIANVEESHHQHDGGKHGHGGGCSQGHGNETERTIIINFEIVNLNSKTSVK